MKFLSRCLLFILWIVILGAVVWTFGALVFDLPWPGLRWPAAIAYALFVLAILFLVRGGGRKLSFLFLSFALVLAWWLTLKPSNDRKWQPDVDRVAWAEMEGDEVTFYNVRNFDYRTATDFTPRWETRTVRLSQLTGLNITINYWGSPWIAHPIISFEFADAPPIAFSIETRKEIGEVYSAIGGLYRQYELIYIVANESDVIRVRTEIRSGETAFLYRTVATPAQARERFLEYVNTLNQLRHQPRWYNAITTNCTTAIRTQRAAYRRAPWDWRMLLNGKGDQMMYERGMFVTDGLAFPELRQRALIDPAAPVAPEIKDFSQRIRAGRPGFQPSQ